jgi:hypothetical protein
MKRLLLVSGNLGLRMAVGNDFEIVEERPSRNWRFNPMSVEGVDAVLLDLHNPETACEVLDQIAATGYSGAILVCAVSGDDWSAVDDRTSKRIGLVELPVSGHDLAAALSALLPSDRSIFGGRRAERSEAASAAQAKPHRDGQPSPAATVPEVPAAPSPVALPSQRSTDVYDHVRQLAAAAPQLRGLQDVAEDLLQAAIDAVSSQAGAVLVPDGEYWRVAAGLEVRHVEWRLALPADSWVIDETVGQRHGVIVEGTDIARQRLSGVPLASWDHLIVAAAPNSDVVLLLAREEPAYTDDDMRGLQATGEKFTKSLRDSIELRELSRSLQRFTDADLRDDNP